METAWGRVGVPVSKVVRDPSRDALITPFGAATLADRYLLPGEGIQDLFARVAATHADDRAHAQRLYDYMSKLWFTPATPILSNSGAGRGMTISCFVNEVGDSLNEIVDLWNENVWLASNGGGIGTYWGHLRSIGERVGRNGKTSGIIPFVKVSDSLTLAISQGSLRRGSAATYLPIFHPEIEEFIEIRRPTGGDPRRKAANIHHGVCVTDAFMRAVVEGAPWDLVSPKDGAVIRTVQARDLFYRLLTARVETGEPYILFIDRVNDQRPAHHKALGLEVRTSNLCSEITLPTGRDHLGLDRTAVCCLSSLNLATWDQWKDNPIFIEDVARFLDNVLERFIATAPPSMHKAVYSAFRERSVGLGVMGLHDFFQARMVPFGSATALSWNKRIFKHIRAGMDAASTRLAMERGANPDAIDAGDPTERFSCKLAVAPTASISIIAGQSSPGIEPRPANAFKHVTLSGTSVWRNPHLAALLEKYGRNDDATWEMITVAGGGSVAGLDFLTDLERDVFKTAMEIDQRWIIQMAADRQPYVCQSQSVNLFLPATVSKADLVLMHAEAWRLGLKSLYYLRSASVQESEVSGAARRQAVTSTSDISRYEECVACQ